MNLYLDASALAKRYIAEPGTAELERAMARTERCFICRIGLVEVGRAVRLRGGRPALAAFLDDWPSFHVLEVDGELAERALALTLRHDLRSLDALHLAAALTIPSDTVTVATWDSRLHAAASAEGLTVTPGVLG